MPWCRLSSCTWPTPVWNQSVKDTWMKLCMGVISQTIRDHGGEMSVLASRAILGPALKLCSTRHNSCCYFFTLALSNLCRWGWIPVIQSSVSPSGTKSSHTHLDKVMPKKTGGTQRRGPLLYQAAWSWLLLKGEHSLCYLECFWRIPPLQMESYIFLSSTQRPGLLCAGHVH